MTTPTEISTLRFSPEELKTLAIAVEYQLDTQVKTGRREERVRLYRMQRRLHLALRNLR